MKFNTFFLVYIFLLFSLPSVAQNEKASVSFKINKALTTVQGSFEKIYYQISLNEDGTGNIFGTADIASVQSKNKKRDEHLQEKDWFYTEKFSKIEISSQKISKLSEGHYKGTFEINIKGQKQTKEIEFKTVKSGEKKLLKANFSLFIEDFGIGGGFLSYLVGNEVQVSLHLTF